MIVSATGRRGIDLLADLWFPGTERSPRMTELPDYRRLVDRALDANHEMAQALSEIAGRAADDESLTVESWPAATVEEAFMVLLSAYYMSSDVRSALGYPGQDRRPVGTATPDQQATDELLAPVIDRGPIYVATPGAELTS
ncbi:hypothetical protein [Rhodococcus koreensis]